MVWKGENENSPYPRNLAPEPQKHDETRTPLSDRFSHVELQITTDGGLVGNLTHENTRAHARTHKSSHTQKEEQQKQQQQQQQISRTDEKVCTGEIWIWICITQQATATAPSWWWW